MPATWFGILSLSLSLYIILRFLQVIRLLFIALCQLSVCVCMCACVLYIAWLKDGSHNTQRPRVKAVEMPAQWNRLHCTELILKHFICLIRWGKLPGEIKMRKKLIKNEIIRWVIVVSLKPWFVRFSISICLHFPATVLACETCQQTNFKCQTYLANMISW